MSTVTADITVSVNVQDTSTSGTIASGGLTVNVNETAKLNYNATNPNTNITKEWSGVLTPAVSTPTTLDLTALTGPLGSAVSFASVVAIYVYNTSAHPIGVGNAGSNPFAPGWSESTHVETVNAGSRWVKENNGTAWTVDSTHKNLMFDPGAFLGNARVIILGN
jgi:hypothetical protein